MSSEPISDTPRAVVVNPADPYERRAQTFPQLTAEQVERAMEFGAEEATRKGTPLFARGDRGTDFFIVLEGTIEIHDHTPSGSAVFYAHEVNEFTGDLDLFNDRKVLVGARMGSTGRVLRIRRPSFRRLLAAEPDIGETVMRAFILRRMGLMEHEQAAAILIGARISGELLRLYRFLDNNGYPVRIVDPESSEEGRNLVATHRLTDDDLPAVLLAYSRVLKNPRTRELAIEIGLSEPLDPSLVYDVAIIGAGPAGLAAAVYSASEGLCTLVLESEAPGGQAGTSSKIENYLGFPTGISGQALAGRAMVQAQKFGARLAVPHRVKRLICDEHPYTLELEDEAEPVKAKTIVIATGARYRKLDLPNFDNFEGKSIHYAATAIEAGLCDGEEIVVVGGGNSAGQAAMYLSRHASRVHMLVRGPELAASMSEYLISRIYEKKSIIKLHLETEITTLAGGRMLEQVTWRNRRTGTEEVKAIANVFLMLGAVPNTEWLRGCVVLDDNGFVRCGDFDRGGEWQIDRVPFALETSRRGVFAVGDVRSGSVKRVASGVGEGSIVVSAIHKIIAEM